MDHQGFQMLLDDIDNATSLHTEVMNDRVESFVDPTFPWVERTSFARQDRTFGALRDEINSISNEIAREYHENPLRLPRSSVFAKSHEQAIQIGKMQAALLKQHKDVPIKLARDTHFENDGYTVDLAHLDKVRRARTYFYLFLKGYLSGPDIQKVIGPFLNGNRDNKEGLTTETMEEITRVQRETCDVLFLALFRAFYIIGEENWNLATDFQKRKFYQDLHREMPLAIDRLIYANEAHAVDFATIHANQTDPVAAQFRQLSEYKFIRLAEYTMYYRIQQFWDWRRPVYNLFKTLRFDDAIETLGISMDVEDVPGVHEGARGVNNRPLPVAHSRGYNPFTLR